MDKMKKIIFALFYFLLAISLNNIKADELSDLLAIDDSKKVENKLFTASCSQDNNLIKCTVSPDKNIYIYKDSIKTESTSSTIAKLSVL